MSRRSIVPLGVSLLFVAATTAMAQESPRPCAADIKAYCTNIEPGGGRIAACIKEHIGEFSPTCKVRLIRAIVAARECAPDVKEQCAGTRHSSEKVTPCLTEIPSNLTNVCKTAILSAILRSR